MNQAIDKLLSQVYELEGLLLVIEKHKGDVSPFVYEMIQKKAERIREMAPLCTPDIFPEEKANEELSCLAEKNGDKCMIETDSLKAVESVVDTLIAELPESEIENVDNEKVFGDVDCDEDTSYICDTEKQAQDNEDFMIMEESEEAIRLDEALQRTLSKDLSRAFSLNDRFRYRRELFSNSEVEMRNTLNIVEAMQSYAEAEDYFYGDLEWDSESTEVKDFMTIIKNHFL